MLHLHQLQHLAHGGVDLLLRLLEHFEAEADVLRDGHVREQGIVLEHGVNRALVRWQTFEVFVEQQDFTLGGLFESRDQTQERRLAATGRTEQGKKFVVLDLQRNVVERDHARVTIVAIHLGGVANIDSGDCIRR